MGAELTPNDHAQATGDAVRALLAGLVAGGVDQLCLCPGSRSTPVAVEAWRQPGMRVWTHLDERSCAFFALGLARASGQPVALLCTSGTAAANFLPAVVEASLAHVPLVVLTADRPPELRGVGAPQTIDQVRLYGSHAKAFVELPAPAAGASTVAQAAHWGARAAALASAVPRGPVHCNLPFREPLIPAAGDGPTAGPPRHDSVRRMPAEDDIARWAAAIGGAQRGLIVCGPLDDAASARAIARLSAVSGFPLFADPLSQLRGEAGAGQGIDVYDAIIRSEAGRTLEPDLILRFGAALTSKATQEWLAARSRRGVAHLVALGDHEWPDPSTAAADTIEAAPDAIAALLAGARAASSGSPLSAWPELWRRLAATARGAIDEALAGASEISEPGVIRALDAVLPQGAALILGNSMPVRDADSFLVASRRPLRVFANRGANGIDGVVSTACGIAAAGVSPAVLVVGDISFYHDLNGLLALRRYDLPLTIVVVNNDGGGIFHFLPQAEAVPEFEPLFGTPHGLRFAHAAELYGIPYAAPADDAALRRELQRGLGSGSGGGSIIEVCSERASNRDLHRAVWARVAAALAPLIRSEAGR